MVLKDNMVLGTINKLQPGYFPALMLLNVQVKWEISVPRITIKYVIQNGRV